METQAPYSHAPAPQAPPRTYAYPPDLPAPGPDPLDLLHAAATALIAAAGLPAMELSVKVDRHRTSARTYLVMAYDPDARRNPLDVCSAHSFARSFDECLRRLATSLLVWATAQGLLNESAANAGKELAHV